MITTYTYALNKIESGSIFGFSADEYSRFKFGCKDIARKFGTELAEGFIRDRLGWLQRQDQIVVISSPYCFIPTATFAMKDYFVQRLNQELVQHGMPVCQETKIHRTITYKEDYGALDAEQRYELIKNDSFHIDTAFVKGKVLIFLDDVKITGSHERMIRNMAEKFNLNNRCEFVYFGALTNDKIHPDIENHLNYYNVKSLLDLDKIIKNENFLLNTRVVKYILCAPYREFRNFIIYQKYKLVCNIYHQAIGNSYHLIDDYKLNLGVIEAIVNGNDDAQIVNMDEIFLKIPTVIKN